MFLAKWKESLEIFSKKELLPFVSDSLNNFVKSCLIYFKYFWLFLLAYSYCIYTFIGLLADPSKSETYFFKLFLIFIIFLVLAFLFSLFISTGIYRENKNYRLLSKAAPNFLGFLIVNLLTFLALPLYCFGAGVFATFFYFDGEGNFKSIFRSAWNGIKFSWYYLPACLIFVLIASIFKMIFLFFKSLDSWIQSLIPNAFLLIVVATIGYVLLSLLLLSFLWVFYNKMIQKDHDLFLKK